MHNHSHNSNFTRLYLIRHGQTELNKNKMIQGKMDVPLNRAGVKQAKAAAKRMRTHYPFDIIYSSPYQRALKTAQIISQKSTLEVVVDPNLIEIDFGSLTNHTLDDFEPEQVKYLKAFNHFILTNRELGTPRPEIPHGETIIHIDERIQSFINKILSQHKGQKIAVISHGGFLKCLVTSLSGISLNGYVPFWIENASISIVDFYDHVPIIRMLNDTSYLNQPIGSSVLRIF